jgi:hypothetical protein
VKKLLAFRGFAHDPQGVLATVREFALVRVEHGFKFTFRQFRDPIMRLEGLIAMFADCGQREGESHQTQMPLVHGYSLAHSGGRA